MSHGCRPPKCARSGLGFASPTSTWAFSRRLPATCASSAAFWRTWRHAARSWRKDRQEVVVELENGQQFAARQLLVTAGPWAPQLLSDLGVPLVVRRKHVHWFASDDASYHQDQGCPTFLYELPQGVFYGFPQIDALGVKVAEHSGGLPVPDPLADPRQLCPTDLARVEDFVRTHLPGIGRQPLRHSVCFYTMSPDENFIVDRHPASESVLFAAGLSGHGFKFMSVLGEALADLALHGKTMLPIGFLGLERFGQARRLPHASGPT
jgi:sarcosine oxidase